MDKFRKVRAMTVLRRSIAAPCTWQCKYYAAEGALTYDLVAPAGVHAPTGLHRIVISTDRQLGDAQRVENLHMGTERSHASALR